VLLDDVQLAWPPLSRVPVLAAGEGPKTIALVGEVADGIVMTTGSSPGMVRTAVDSIRSSRADAAVPEAFEVVVFLMADFGAGSAARIEHEFDAWKLSGERRFAATGNDEDVEGAVQQLYDAGATTVLLQPREQETDLDGYAASVARVARRLAAG
jgi:alkanesulfonate monooxygenase SsuD/methylene tetrahydromethanopterin reductase-like flavin-dependent oxidoreductase (luciferase family)